MKSVTFADEKDNEQALDIEELASIHVTTTSLKDSETSVISSVNENSRSSTTSTLDKFKNIRSFSPENATSLTSGLPVYRKLSRIS